MIHEQQTTENTGSKVVVKAVPTDFSPASDRALEYALLLARHYGSHLIVAHVITLDGYPMIAPDLAAAREQKYHQEAKDAMARLVRSGRLGPSSRCCTFRPEPSSRWVSKWNPSSAN
jgi:nucleotide-binding universal stress UspA family protein